METQGQTMKNNLTTTQKTEVVLAKGKSLLGITDKILSGSKASATATTHKDVTIIGDLMWENVANPEEHEMDWYSAMEYAKNLRLGGYDDWRLPTIEELVSVVHECGGMPVSYLDIDDEPINYELIIDKNDENQSYQVCYKAKSFETYCEYWSSTTNMDDTSCAWIMAFWLGCMNDSDKSDTGYVRCVR